MFVAIIEYVQLAQWTQLLPGEPSPRTEGVIMTYYIHRKLNGACVHASRTDLPPSANLVQEVSDDGKYLRGERLFNNGELKALFPKSGPKLRRLCDRMRR